MLRYILNVPMIRQESSTTCWWACAKMLKAYYIKQHAPREDLNHYIKSMAESQRMDMSITNPQQNTWTMNRIHKGRRYVNRAAHHTNRIDPEPGSTRAW